MTVHAKYTLKLDTTADADIIEYLEKQPDKNDIMWWAVRQMMALDAWAKAKQEEATVQIE